MADKQNGTSVDREGVAMFADYADSTDTAINEQYAIMQTQAAWLFDEDNYSGADSEPVKEIYRQRMKMFADVIAKYAKVKTTSSLLNKTYNNLDGVTKRPQAENAERMAAYLNKVRSTGK